jgi:hypothetical protein
MLPADAVLAREAGPGVLLFLKSSPMNVHVMSHLLQHPAFLALLHALDGIVLDRLFLSAFIDNRMLAPTDLLVYTAATFLRVS